MMFVMQRARVSSVSYLENVVLDVTDLNSLVGTSIWSRGSQQRLESKGENMSIQNYLMKKTGPLSVNVYTNFY